MASTDWEANVAAFVRRTFSPDLRDMDECLRWIEQQVRERTRGVDAVLFEEFRSFVRELNAEQAGDGLFVLLDPGDHAGPTLIKRAPSVLEKMVRMADEDGPEAPSTPEALLDRMDDLIRLRILCNYLSDVHVVVGALRRRYPASERDLCCVGESDRLWLPPEERKRGHRAVHLAFEVRWRGRRLRFEVQVTTILHWGWDKKDHTLVYEPQRQGRVPSGADRISIAAASDTLYLVDEFFDHLRQRMRAPRRTKDASATGDER